MDRPLPGRTVVTMVATLTLPSLTEAVGQPIIREIEVSCGWKPERYAVHGVRLFGEIGIAIRQDFGDRWLEIDHTMAKVLFGLDVIDRLRLALCRSLAAQHAVQIEFARQAGRVTIVEDDPQADAEAWRRDAEIVCDG